jgi:uncharacterized membrane protein YgcG
MRSLILAAFLALPLAAQAQTAPPTFAVPAPVLQHVVTYLAQGGSHAEGQALAEQISALAQQQMAAQKPTEAPTK